MSALRQYLTQFLQISEVVEGIAANIDANETGIDDQFAKFVDLQVQPPVRAFLMSLPPDVNAGAAQGYTAILNFCSGVLTKINLVIESTVKKDEKIAMIKSLIADLYDHTKVYPAKSGKDAEVLSNTKEKAAEKLAKVEAE